MKSRTLLLPCPSQQAPTSASVRKTTVTSSKLQRQRTQTISRSTSHHNPFHQENHGSATSTPPASTSLAPISSTQESAANSNQFHQIPTYSTETRESISSNVSTLLLRPLTKEFVASTTCEHTSNFTPGAHSGLAHPASHRGHLHTCPP